MLPKGWQINLAGAYAKASTEFVESNFALDNPAIVAGAGEFRPGDRAQYLRRWLAYERGSPRHAARQNLLMT